MKNVWGEISGKHSWHRRGEASRHGSSVVVLTIWPCRWQIGMNSWSVYTIGAFGTLFLISLSTS
jgi:hypothetical protein